MTFKIRDIDSTGCSRRIPFLSVFTHSPIRPQDTQATHPWYLILNGSSDFTFNSTSSANLPWNVVVSVLSLPLSLSLLLSLELNEGVGSEVSPLVSLIDIKGAGLSSEPVSAANVDAEDGSVSDNDGEWLLVPLSAFWDRRRTCGWRRRRLFWSWWFGFTIFLLCFLFIISLFFLFLLLFVFFLLSLSLSLGFITLWFRLWCRSRRRPRVRSRGRWRGRSRRRGTGDDKAKSNKNDEDSLTKCFF